MNLKYKIKNLYSTFSKSELIIADFILKNTAKASEMTITELSIELGLAESTIFKFTKHLGYNGFRSFRNDLLAEVYDSKISVRNDINIDDGYLNIAKKVFDTTAKSLSDTFDVLNDGDLEKASKFINNCDKLYLFGIGGSSIVCFDAYHKFMRTTIDVRYIEDYHLQLMESALIEENDCAIVVSHSGITKEMITISEEVKNNSGKIILLTSYPGSYLENFSDVTLISMSDETKYRSESLSSRIAQLTIIDTLYTMAVINQEKKSNEILSKIRKVINKTKE